MRTKWKRLGSGCFVNPKFTRPYQAIMTQNKRCGLRFGKMVILAGCCICFGANSWMIISQYWRKTTTTAKFSVKSPNGIDPPSLTFCGHKNQLLSEQPVISVTNSEDHKDAIYDIIPKNTLYRGICYNIDLKDKLRKSNYLTISVKNYPMELFINEKSYEKFLYVDWIPIHWLTKVPIKLDNTSLDLSITLVVHQRMESSSCADNNMADFVNCYFSKIAKPVEEEGPDCSTSSAFDLFGIKKSNSCNESQVALEQETVFKAMEKVYSSGQCKVPCAKVEYEVFVWELPYGDRKQLYLMSSGDRIFYEDQVLCVDFNTFISSVGGSLGLFLGFSMLDTLTALLTEFWKRILFRASPWSKSFQV